MHAWHARSLLPHCLSQISWKLHASSTVPLGCTETEHPRGRESEGKKERKKRKKNPKVAVITAGARAKSKLRVCTGDTAAGSSGPPPRVRPAPLRPVPGEAAAGAAPSRAPGPGAPRGCGRPRAQHGGAAPEAAAAAPTRGRTRLRPARPTTAAPARQHRAGLSQAEPSRAGRLSPHRAPHGSRSPRRFLIHPGPGGAGAAEQGERPPYTHTHTPAGASTGTHPPARSRVPGAVPGSELSERRRRAGSHRRLPAATARARRSPPRAPPTGRALTCGSPAPPHPGERRPWCCLAPSPSPVPSPVPVPSFPSYWGRPSPRGVPQYSAPWPKALVSCSCCGRRVGAEARR